MFKNHTFMVEFMTLSNRIYSVQYSPDLRNWQPVTPALTGDGNWVQWIDDGEPKTAGMPASQSARFYRVMLLPEPQFMKYKSLFRRSTLPAALLTPCPA